MKPHSSRKQSDSEGFFMKDDTNYLTKNGNEASIVDLTNAANSEYIANHTINIYESERHEIGQENAITLGRNDSDEIINHNYSPDNSPKRRQKLPRESKADVKTRISR